MSNEIFDEPVAVSENSLAALLEAAEELLDLEAQLEQLDNLAKRLNGRATELKTQLIPDKMAEVGLTEFATPDGSRLKVEDFVSGSLPKDPARREAALRTLEQWGAEGVIRNEINLSFEKSQHNEAMALADDLRQQGFSAEVKSGVHPQTYLAVIRERLRSGETIDPEAMGVFVGRKTKVILGGVDG